ncbi:MAG: hypothetical protein ABFE08_04860 [Armatimonadia bacterium]
MPTELHLALQQYYAGDDGEVEVPLRGYRADVLREGVIYEIQTGSFGAIRRKLEALTRHRRVVLVYPVACEKTIVHVDTEGRELRARRSPKRGAVADLFGEVLRVADLLARKRLSIEVIVTRERELRCDDGAGSWRRKGVSLVGRELVEVVEAQRFEETRQFLGLLPEGLPEEFTVRDLVTGGVRKALAGKMAYALRTMGVIEKVGKKGNAFVYKTCV